MPERARIAVIGAGWWGAQVYVPTLLADPRAELVAVTRTDREGLDRLAETYGVKGYTDHHEMLAAEPRVTATAIQTVGSKGYDGFAMVLVN